MESSACPVCGNTEHTDVLALPDLPVLINAQVRPEHGLDVLTGDIDLVVCHGCGHLFNRSFDPKLLDYDATYENTLHFSPAFQEFARPLASRLVAEHDLVGRRVAELGSGPGHFLSMLCEAGAAEGLGYDPSYDPDRLGAPDHPAVSISRDLFPDDGSLPVALAFSQHVLEHLDDPVAALRAQRDAVVERGGTVYAEVPNGRLMIERSALWDLIYEHLSYFVPTSLEVACRRAGLTVDRLDTAFADQFLWCEAHPGKPEPAAVPPPDAVRTAVDAATSFASMATERIDGARGDLAGWAREGPVALWGAGSKGATYLNLMRGVADISAVVDINPRKTDWGIPGTALRIQMPTALTEIRPRTVVAANPVYRSEIEAKLRSLGIDAVVRPLWD